MSPDEIICAPFTIWIAPVGTAFPALTAEPAGAWRKLGTHGARSYSENGTAIQHSQQHQTSKPAGRSGTSFTFASDEELRIAVELYDLTLEQYAHVLGQNVVTVNPAQAGLPGTRSIGLSLRRRADSSVAILVRGPSPYDENLIGQYEVPIARQVGTPRPIFRKNAPAILAVEWLALEDPNATSEDTRFGRLVTQAEVALTTDWKLAGSGYRQATSFNTVAGNNYKAVDWFTWLPPGVFEEIALFFPTFYATATQEVDCPNGYTVRGIATKDDAGLRTLGTIDGGTAPIVLDPAQAATQNGKWIVFRPAEPIVGGGVRGFAYEGLFPDGAIPEGRGLASENNLINMFGDPMPFERSLGSNSSLLSTLSDSTPYTNAGGPPPPLPSLMMLRGIQKSFFAIGDSIDFGSQQSRNPIFYTDRMAFGSLEMGLVEDQRGQSLPGNNLSLPGWSIDVDETGKSHANTTASARQLWMIQKARELNSGNSIADMIWCGHGQNSSSNSLANLEAGVRAFAAIWRPAVGDENTPIYWTGMRASVESTDGFQTLANQSPVNTQATFPGGSRWAFNDALEPGGSLRIDGTVQGAAQYYPVSSAPDPDRDIFTVLDYNGTVSAAYGGSGDIEITSATPPKVGMWLIFINPADGVTELGQGPVNGFSGTGPYLVDVGIPGSPSFPVNTIVQESWDDGGVHPAPLRHVDYAEPIIDLKIALGFAKSLSAPAFTSAEITGVPTDGGTLTATYEATGNPTPDPGYQWLDRNLNPIIGQEAATFVPNETAQGWQPGDFVACDITLTNSEGSVTQRVTIEYVDASSLALTQGSPEGYFVDPSNVPAGTVRIVAEIDIEFPTSVPNGSKLCTQESTGCDLEVLADGTLRATVEDGTFTRTLTTATANTGQLLSADTAHSIIFDVSHARQDVRLTVDGGTPIVTPFTQSGNGVFQTGREFSFLAGTNGASVVPPGTIIRRLAVTMYDSGGAVLRTKTISMVAANANNDPWHREGDFS